MSATQHIFLHPLLALTRILLSWNVHNKYIEDGECNQRLLDRMVSTDSIVKVINEGKGYSLIMFVANHSDIPMAQFIINFNNSMPNAHKFIIHILDDTHLFVQENVVEMIRKKVQDFRDQNTFEKPT